MPTAVLNFSTVPTVDLQFLRSRFAKLSDLLAARLDVRVRLRVASSYEELLDGMLLGRFDLVVAGARLWLDAFDGGARYEALARPVRDGEVDYRAAIFVRRDSGIRGLDQLARHRVAFVSKSSTAGFAVPRAALSRAGVSLPALGTAIFAGSHSEALTQVLMRKAEAACSFEHAIDSLTKDPAFMHEALTTIWTSEPVPHELFALRCGFAAKHPALAKKLAHLLPALHSQPEGREALEAMGTKVERLDAVGPLVYENARKLLRRT